MFFLIAHMTLTRPFSSLSFRIALNVYMCASVAEFPQSMSDIAFQFLLSSGNLT
jgi:hypothetical protein